jgi:hypothetical protein
VERAGFADYFVLSAREALQLELMLNVTPRGHELSHIGDALYKYAGTGGMANETLKLNTDEYRFMQSLNINRTLASASNAH